MEEIYKGQARALYAQVGLVDAEDTGSYPQWETGEEAAIFGPKGVAVATAPDACVEIIVYKGKGKTEDIFCASGEIEVGNEGLIVGNLISSNIGQLDWPPGRVLVSIYVNGSPREVTRVIFVLENLS